MAIEWSEETETIVVEWNAAVTDASGIEHRVTIERWGDDLFVLWGFDGSIPPPNRRHLMAGHDFNDIQSAAETWLLNQQEGAT